MPSPPAPAKILIVDDDPDILGLLGGLLRQTQEIPNETTLETDPKAAVELLEDHKFDLAISDYMMPGMDGGELLLAVKSRNPEALRMLMTAHATHQAALLAVLTAQVHSYIEKPFEPSEVLATIRDLLARRQEASVDGLAGFVDPGDRALALVGELTQRMQDAPPEVAGLAMTLSFPSTSSFNHFATRAFQDRPGEVKEIRFEDGHFLVTVSCFGGAQEALSSAPTEGVRSARGRDRLSGSSRGAPSSS